MITEPCYCSREDVKSAPDFNFTAYNNAQIDRAIQASARKIDNHLHRRFYPRDRIVYLDWPNWSYAPPWKIYFSDFGVPDLISVTAVESPPGTPLTLANCFLEPRNSGPPFTWMELDRSKTTAFDGGATPQRSIKITGTWGYSADTDAAGTLAAAIVSTSATSLTVSDASKLGVGDLLIVDTERMLVQERASVTTGQTQLSSGVSTASDADNVLALTDGTQVHLGEVLILDAERMLVLDITGNNVLVKRAYDGTVLTTHSGATVYAYRSLTVARGQLGTTAATHSNSAPVSRHRPPTEIRNLAIAEAANTVLQETGGYSNPQGEDIALIHGIGSALADLWDEVRTGYGRKNRIRGV